MEEKPNYYEILGVSPQASKDEIKRAYRLLAKKFHPDVYKGADATVRFEQITDAYNILYDDLKRMAFDNSLANSKQQQYSRQNARPQQQQQYGQNPFTQYQQQSPFQQNRPYTDPRARAAQQQQQQQPHYSYDPKRDYDEPHDPNEFSTNADINQAGFDWAQVNPFFQNSFTNSFNQNQFQGNGFYGDNGETFCPRFNPYIDNIQEEENFDISTAYEKYSPFGDTLEAMMQSGPISTIDKVQRTASFNKSLNSAYTSYDPNTFKQTPSFLNVEKNIKYSKDAKMLKLKLDLSIHTIRKKLENYMYLKNTGQRSFELKRGNRNFKNIIIISDDTNFEIIGQPTSKIIMAAGRQNMICNNDDIGSFVECYGNDQTLIILPNSNQINTIKIGLPYYFQYDNLYFNSKKGKLSLFSISNGNNLKFNKLLLTTDTGLLQLKSASVEVSVSNTAGNTRLMLSPINENATLNLVSETGSVDLAPEFQISKCDVISQKGRVTNNHRNTNPAGYFLDVKMVTNRGNINIR